MGMIISSGQSGTPSDLRIESDKSAERAITVPRGVGHGLSAVTGVLAAALGANSTVFAMRLDPSSAVRAYIDRIRLQYTTIVAYTVPLTAGRRLGIYRGAGAGTTGGTSIPSVVKKHTLLASSEFDTANGGAVSIAATAALTVAGITFEADPVAMMTLSHVGAAGAYLETVFEFAPSESYEIVLEPGQLLAIRNPIAMDAAGTWQLGVNVQWREAPLY